MATLFDALTVACFIGVVVVFFQFTQRDTPTLLRCLLSSVALAMANHLGNMGYLIFAFILVVAAMGFLWLAIRKPTGSL